VASVWGKIPFDPNIIRWDKFRNQSEIDLPAWRKVTEGRFCYIRKKLTKYIKKQKESLRKIYNLLVFFVDSAIIIHNNFKKVETIFTIIYKKWIKEIRLCLLTYSQKKQNRQAVGRWRRE
jgi:hypothetical protein